MSRFPTREQPSQIVRPVAAGARRPVGAAPASGAGFSGRDFVRLVRKRKWMILLSTVVFSGLSVSRVATSASATGA